MPALGLTGNVLLLMAVGAVLGTGILVLVLGLLRVPVVEQPSVRETVQRRAEQLGRRIPIAVGVALVVLVLSRWPVLAVGSGLLAYFWNSLFGGAVAERMAYARLEGLAAWTESLRDTIAGAVGLEQAIPATAEAAGATIQRPLRVLSDRLRVRVPMAVALHRFSDDLDDPAADLIVAALVLNAKLRGPGLRNVLTSLSGSVRAELEMRGRVMAGRRSTRRSVQIVVCVSVGFVLLLRLFNPGYVAPYNTLFGQLVLLLVVGLFAAGFLWLRRLATFQVPRRFLRSSTGATALRARAPVPVANAPAAQNDFAAPTVPSVPAVAAGVPGDLDGSGLNGSGLNGSGLNGSGLNGSGPNGSGPNGSGLNGSGLNGSTGRGDH